MPAFPRPPETGPASPGNDDSTIDPRDRGEPPPRWATRLLNRLGRRWWLMTAALLPVVAGLVGCGLSVAAMRELVLAGLPIEALFAAEVPRAVILCLWLGLAAGGLVVFTAPAWSARPFAVMCAATAAAIALDAGAQDLEMSLEGRGTGPREIFSVWIAPTVLGLLAVILYLEHKHGRHTVRNDEDGPALRVWTPDE
ncbi:hypothetical protein [Alienimonas chondri]|uniref:Uncharacterized protein n=1 Tax=Alienimonas chondri TaxID=2681879 RepID=A0ABX1VGM5_9PLAN|nr:hypothetical protein [Alienimonas chondri]NNJ27206.1 hypothetical protein [Alienimonas chondri]